MTNKTEDKFYFQQSKFVVCVLFGGRCVFQTAYATLSEARNEAKKAVAKYGQYGNEYLPTLKATVEIKEYQGSSLISQHKFGFSHPGQPDKFDASSLDRGNFAEASKSPMLGKLLSEKAMPDGGWRAVQVGSDTLVISFEDADLARDFGRRAASMGLFATSAVATSGGYWIVEVKYG